jgi:uncharacterized YigZ family protein
MKKIIEEKNNYLTIRQPAYAAFKDRGSKFIAFAYPVPTVEDFKKYLHQLKQEHLKANHHCFAYRIGIDGNNFRVSDDGEPSGTAGKPILNQIDSKQLTNVAVVVVRYFGGTLLGVPGLINAYKTAAAYALKLTPIITQPIELPYELHFNYTQLNEVMMLVKQFNCSILQQEQTLFCRMKMGIPKAKLTEVLAKLNDLHTVEIKAM